MSSFPRRLRVPWRTLALLFLLVGLAACQPPAVSPAADSAKDGYLFCFWNVENLFDDRHDANRPSADRPEELVHAR